MMWLDPGAMTGWARLADGYSFTSGEAEFQIAGEVVRQHCRISAHPSVGWERFDITPGTYRMKGSSEAIEVIGAARWIAAEEGALILAPAAREARNAVSPGLLKAAGWHRPGAGHANDAARHMLSFLIRTRNMVPALDDTIRSYLQEQHDASQEPGFAVRGTDARLQANRDQHDVR